jgi:hypothetical protein
MRLYQTLTLACTSLMISACASVAPVRDANNVNDKVRFNMDGRFSVQYVEKNTDKNLTGKSHPFRLEVLLLLNSKSGAVSRFSLQSCSIKAIFLRSKRSFLWSLF